MESSAITTEEFIYSAKEFVGISNRICDGWKLVEDETDIHKSFIKKDLFIQSDESNSLLKAEFVIFYNLSYGVPSFSFNVWNSSGMLLALEDIRQMSFINEPGKICGSLEWLKINQKDFYSVITQQEHPVFFRPYFIMHPCHTLTLLEQFRRTSKNLIVTFLSLITPLIKLNLPLEYGKGV